MPKKAADNKIYFKRCLGFVACILTCSLLCFESALITLIVVLTIITVPAVYECVEALSEYREKDQSALLLHKNPCLLFSMVWILEIVFLNMVQHDLISHQILKDFGIASVFVAICIVCYLITDYCASNNTHDVTSENQSDCEPSLSR